ncbi:MAG: serine hydrolase domain-containing protein [Vicinamibacterales bacterium]
MTLSSGLRAALASAVAACTLACGQPAPPAAADPSPASPVPPAAAVAPDRLARVARAFPAVDAAFREFAERAHAPGIAWGIVVDGALAHAGSWGVRDVPSKAAIDPDTVFRIASMTKSFTAVSILRLRDEGRLSLEDPAERWVPELAGLRYPTADSPRITIRHLLSHATGFPEDNPWGDRQLARTDAEMAEMLERGIPFSRPPGLAYEYSNYGFAILGRVVANVSGRPYAEYVRTNLLEPLGMTSTTLQAGDVPADRMARGYRWEDERWKDEPALPDGAFGSMGGMLTSTRDLARWVGFLAGAWPPRDDPDAGPVRRASLREMQEVARPRPATVRVDGEAIALNAGGYGYGLRIQQTCEFDHVVAHTGGLPGYGSVMTWLPDYGVAVIAMSNLTYTSASGVAAGALTTIVRESGLEPYVPAPAPALLEAQQAVTALVNAWDDQVADRIAAENLFLDQDRARRRAAIEALHAQVGQCRAEAPLEPENALRGQWTLDCERGRLRVAVTLAPSMPPTVQFLSVQPATEANTTPAPACSAR